MFAVAPTRETTRVPISDTLDVTWYPALYSAYCAYNEWASEWRSM